MTVTDIDFDEIHANIAGIVGRLQKLHNSLNRVQELCESLTLPEATRHQYGVTFNDGSHANMHDVLAEGREALAEVAALFDQPTPAVCTPEAPNAEANHGG